MKKTATIAALGGSALLIAGCAVPVPLQVASWALDGISLLVTEKSVTDHGLSIVAKQDCAVWRGVTEGELCRDWDDGGTMVAERDSLPEPVSKPVLVNSFAPPAQSDIPLLNTNLDDSLPNIEELTNFVTAAGPAPRTPSVTRPLQPPVASAPKRLAAATTVRLAPQPVAYKTAAKVVARPAVAKTAPPKRQIATARVKPAASEPVAGIYFVIGSFRNYGNARDLAGRYGGLVPEVLAAKLDGAPVYRVVVGPAQDGQERALHRRVARAGLSDTWAIRVTPGDWSFAEAVIERKRRAGIGVGASASTELAATQR